MRSLLLFLLIPTLCDAQEVRIPPVDFVRANVPMHINISRPGSGHFALTDASNSSAYPLQWENDSTAWFILDRELAPGQELLLTLSKVSKPAAQVEMDKQKNGIAVNMNGRDILFYQTATAEPPVDSPSYYKRSGFIHPLYSPSGSVLTDDFPSNHAHQHALFHAWTNTRFRGHHVDFWNQHHQEGTVNFRRVVKMEEGPVYSELVTEQEYVSLKDGVVLLEEWRLRFYAVNDHFLFDLRVNQKNITNDTLYLDKYIYGGMAFRGSNQWDPHNKELFRERWNVETSEGLKDSSANHRSARWVTITGNVDGRFSSLTIFNHKNNLRYPQKLRVHPDMPYLVYSPVVDAPFTIPPGGGYSAHYRYFVGSTRPSADVLRGIHESWSAH
jgi:hypothetical protein